MNPSSYSNQPNYIVLILLSTIKSTLLLLAQIYLISFPWHDNNTTHDMMMSRVATESTQFHVLAVDDSIIDRKLIERLLKTSSYQVTAVDSGIKALEYLGLLDDDENTDPYSSAKNHHEIEVNLIITDYCMPGMTGYDLLRKIKESTSLKDIPVVIMSSENVPSRINSCLEQGAEEFFLKPVQQSDVNKLKPHLLRGKQEKSEIDHQNLNVFNKRKPLEECVSLDRTRTRYNASEL